MFGIGLPEIIDFLVVVALVAAVALACVVLARRAYARPPVLRPPEAGVRWRLVLLVRLLSLLAGVVVAVQLWSRADGAGRGPMLALAGLGACVLVGTILGETAVRPASPSGARAASLAPRRVRDYLPDSTRTVSRLLVVLVITLLVTTVTAGVDDQGRHRALVCRSPGFEHRQTPYPGAYYSVPLALAVLVVLGLAALAARRVVDRPRGLARSDADEDLLRRSSLDVVVAAAGVAIAAPLTGVLSVAGGALSSASSQPAPCLASWWGWVGLVLLGCALAALVATLVWLGRLFGRSRVPPLLVETGRARGADARAHSDQPA